MTAKVAKISGDVSDLKNDVQEIKKGVGTLLTNIDRVLKNTEKETQKRKVADKQLERRVERFEGEVLPAKKP